ncbi:urease accessory protein UreF [Paenibacillus humicola]|uniref:urease accessory protein UreF n=1 Tax=Paenibacillus humicola TaxID=3110540 RepID=UPI00237B1647|nr:urease accessory protein UreF [Paenibacillus humicola]
MDKWRLVLLQLCDSGFPSGAFSHSFGFETYVQEGRITDSRTFRAWLEAYLLRQWVYNEGFALRLAYEALEGGMPAEASALIAQGTAQTGRRIRAAGLPLDRRSDGAHQKAPEDAAPAPADAGVFAAVWALDRRMAAQTIPHESRTAGIRMGRRMLELVRSLWPDVAGLVEYGAQIAAGRCRGQTAIVFAIVCRGSGVPLREALLHLAYAGSAALVQNAVRAIPLGQTDGQRLLAGLHGVWEAAAEAVQWLHEDDFGISPPGLELAAIRHERLDGRMFMS